MGLGDAIEAAKQREQIQRWNEGERKLTATIVVPEIEVSADLRSRLDPFYKFAESKSVRRLPARPATVACWVRFQAGLGVPIEQILAALAAIETAHDRHCLANPVRTAIVRAELNTIVKVDPPRSWPKQDKAAFALLPADSKQIIATRELQRDNEVRRLQSKTALEIARRDNGPAKTVIKPKEDISYEQT
jgi:hypothetical protein